MDRKLGDVVYQIRKKNCRAKQLTVQFNRLKPFLQPVMGNPTNENIGCGKIYAEMIIVTSEPARPVVPSEQIREAIAETPIPHEP